MFSEAGWCWVRLSDVGWCWAILSDAGWGKVRFDDIGSCWVISLQQDQASTKCCAHLHFASHFITRPELLVKWQFAQTTSNTILISSVYLQSGLDHQTEQPFGTQSFTQLAYCNLYETVHSMKYKVVPQHWKQSRVNIFHCNPPNIGAKITVLTRAFKRYVIWPDLIPLW